MSAVVLLRANRSVRWQSLSLAARGVVLELVSEMQRIGATELALGRRGLETVSRFLGCPWSELEPALEEAIASGKLVHDVERSVLADGDPSPVRALDPREMPYASRSGQSCPFPDRRHELLEEPSPESQTRPLSMTPGAVRKREQRARDRAEREGRQLSFLGTTAASRTRPDVSGHVPLASAAAVAPVSGSPEIFGAPRADTSGTRPSPSLSDLSPVSVKKKQRDHVVLDAAAPPSGWLEVAAGVRPELTSTVLLESWAVFVATKASKATSWQLTETWWKAWVRNERRSSTATQPAERKAFSPPAATDSAPYYRAARLGRPDFEPEAPSSPRRPTVHTPPSPEVVAAAALALRGDFLQAASAARGAA